MRIKNLQGSKSIRATYAVGRIFDKRLAMRIHNIHQRSNLVAIVMRSELAEELAHAFGGDHVSTWIMLSQSQIRKVNRFFSVGNTSLMNLRSS